MLTQTKQWTEAELMALPKDGHRYELVNGDLAMSPAGGFEHGSVIARLSARLTIHVYQRKLGVTFDGQTGFWMKSGGLRCPDVSFVAKSRLRGPRPKGFLNGAPDLAVEVISPSDEPKDIEAKIAEYFDNGAQLVWRLNPVERTVTVYRAATAFRVLHAGEELGGGDLIPGFSVPVVELFEEPDFA
jgi:Uma2 family endonuclease